MRILKMENRDNSLFYCNIEKNQHNQNFIDKLQEYSDINSKQVYVVSKALGTENEYTYEISDIAIILIPKHPIAIVNYGSKNDLALDDFLEDLKEDLGHISDKYEYYKILGRTRKWDSRFFIKCCVNDFNVDQYLDDEVPVDLIRRIDLLISLLTGSINSIEKIGIDEPQTLLDKVKRKIILFDGQQSRFIYSQPTEKRVTIQGLAGTGKTELLLNKLKDVYTNSTDSVIGFTCYNRVLANELRDRRIPQFFNFMKVSEQIEWGSRLHVFSSWGFRNQPESGLISFICSIYGTTFMSFAEYSNFDQLCKKIMQELDDTTGFSPCFDYLFVDESQDFGEGFFQLCEKITRNHVYIAGDIFQNIFDSPGIDSDKPIDYLLNKCYRTDPKTLMFAHAVGMGLYETPKINWLTEEDWKKCGYTFEKTNDTIKLSRKPLRRFEDLDMQDTIKLFPSKSDNIIDTVIECLNSIITDNSNVAPEDIAIILLEKNYDKMCQYANNISYRIEDSFHWKATRGFITRKVEKDSVYISNINHVKGLEFPFLICVVPTKISNNIYSRNRIYTSLTRSFLTSYFVINDDNTEFLDIYSKALMQINDGFIEVKEPSEEEKKQITTNIQKAVEREKLSLEDIVDLVYSDYTKKGINKNMIRVAAEGLISNNLSESEILERLHRICEQMI